MLPPQSQSRSALPLALAGLSLLCAPRSTAAFQELPGRDAADVVTAAVEALGGEDAIRAIASYRLDGMIVTATSGEHGGVHRVARCPTELAVALDYPSRNEVRILSPEGAWRGNDPASLQPVQGPLASAMVLQMARSCLPGLLLEHGDDARLERRTDEMAVVSIDLGQDMHIRVFVSAESGLILRSEATMSTAMGPMEFAADYADYRAVDGVQFPFREETFASGVHTATIIAESIEVNPPDERARLPIPRGR